MLTMLPGCPMCKRPMRIQNKTMPFRQGANYRIDWQWIEFECKNCGYIRSEGPTRVKTEWSAADDGRKTDPEIEALKSQICEKYCKWPDKWDEEKEECCLADSEVCENCPVNKL